MANNKTTDIEIKTCTTNNTCRDRDIKKETDINKWLLIFPKTKHNKTNNINNNNNNNNSNNNKNHHQINNKFLVDQM